MAVLLLGCSGGSSSAPASLPDETPAASANALSSSGLAPIADANLAPATADLAGLVGELNEAEAAFVQALDDDGYTAADLMELQKKVASRALNVGRLADLLADTTGRRDDSASATTADMYTNVASVAYALALDTSATTPADLLEKDIAEAVQAGVAEAWLRLSTGDPDEQEVFRNILGDAYPDDLVTVEVTGDTLPQVAIAGSNARERMETDLDDVLSLTLPDSGTEEALNAAIDRDTTMSLQELAGVAAARLSLFAEPAPQASSAGNLQAQTLSFDVARRIVMSTANVANNTQALRTFVLLADRDDLAKFWALREGKQPDGKDVSSLIFLTAIDAFRGRSDRPDLQFLADVLSTADPLKLAAKYPELASRVQQVLFEEYVAGDEPVIELASARYDGPTNSIALAVSFSNPGRAVTLICDGLDASESVVQVPNGSGQLAVVMAYEANPRDYSYTDFDCRTKYGQAFNGEVRFVDEREPTDTPEAARPTPTPRPAPPTPTPVPSGDECIADPGSAVGLFECE